MALCVTTAVLPSKLVWDVASQPLTHWVSLTLWSRPCPPPYLCHECIQPAELQLINCRVAFHSRLQDMQLR